MECVHEDVVQGGVEEGGDAGYVGCGVDEACCWGVAQTVGSSVGG